MLAEYPKLAMAMPCWATLRWLRARLRLRLKPTATPTQVEPAPHPYCGCLMLWPVRTMVRPALQLAEQWLRKHPRDLADAQGACRCTCASLAISGAAAIAYQDCSQAQPGRCGSTKQPGQRPIAAEGSGCNQDRRSSAGNCTGKRLVIDTLGWALFQNGQTERALQLLRDARLRQPGNPDIRYHLAAVLAHTGRKTEARDWTCR